MRLSDVEKAQGEIIKIVRKMEETARSCWPEEAERLLPAASRHRQTALCWANIGETLGTYIHG